MAPSGEGWRKYHDRAARRHPPLAGKALHSGSDREPRLPPHVVSGAKSRRKCVVSLAPVDLRDPSDFD